MPASASLAASTSFAGSDPEIESPGQATGASPAKVVAGPPAPAVATEASSSKSMACVSPIRTAGSPVSWPSSWLYHCSPTIAVVLTLNRSAPSRRLASGPWMVAALMSPESSRLAAVPSFWTIFITMVSGRPFSSVVAPFGPHV